MACRSERGRGRRRRSDWGRDRGAIYRLGGQLYATHNICSHEHALLSDGYIEGDCIECPLHQARFHIPTGEVRSAPATEPVKTYSIKVQGDQILVDVPDA